MAVITDYEVKVLNVPSWHGWVPRLKQVPVLSWDNASILTENNAYIRFGDLIHYSPGYADDELLIPDNLKKYIGDLIEERDNDGGYDRWLETAQPMVIAPLQDGRALFFYQYYVVTDRFDDFTPKSRFTRWFIYLAPETATYEGGFSPLVLLYSSTDTRSHGKVSESEFFFEHNPFALCSLSYTLSTGVERTNFAMFVRGGSPGYGLFLSRLDSKIKGSTLVYTNYMLPGRTTPTNLMDIHYDFDYPPKPPVPTDGYPNLKIAIQNNSFEVEGK